MSERKEIFAAVAVQMMSGDEVVVGEQKIRVRRVGRGRLRMAPFKIDGRGYEAIEQNPEKPSAWGKLAREGHAVVQFRDLEAHKYVAAVVDGVVREYGEI
ncbi:MAG: hypothetical protein ACLQLC_07610 [Candidatus Sulfotelmatobacter sp.]